MLDADEWIWSLTEAEASTADMPEGHVTYANPGDAAHDEQGVDHKKGTTHPDCSVRAQTRVEAALGAQ